MSRNITSFAGRDPLVPDEVLWENFRQGDRKAYQQFYNKYLDDLYNYGYKIIADKEVVIDHIQDLFIDLWKYKDNLSGIKNVKHYLFRSLRNKITKAQNLNRYIVQDMESTYGNSLMILPFEHKIIESQNNLETKKRLQKAFLALSKRQAEVITLLFYEKFSYEEVASIMGINVSSVYTLAWKSIAILRRELTA